MWNMQTSLFFLLLKFSLEAGEEQYLFLESQIVHNATGLVIILAFESHLLNYMSKVDHSRY